MKKTLLIGALTLLTYFIDAQTAAYPFVSGPSFKSFNNGPAEAGAGWNTTSFNDSAWSYSYVGAGAQVQGLCASGTHPSAWNGGDTIIWSSDTSLAPDTACFRKILKLGHCGKITGATFKILGDDYYLAYINGHFLGTNPTDGIGVIYTFDSIQLSWLCDGSGIVDDPSKSGGENLFAFEVVNSAPNCAELDITATITVDTTVACTPNCAGSLGVNQLEDHTTSVYPNPANNLITVESTGKLALISVFDMIGDRVISQSATGLHTDIDVSHIPMGIYIIQLTDSNGNIINKKITKQ